MLRLLIGTGVLLMSVGFGTAGWQYWKSLPVTKVDAAVEKVPAAPASATSRQSWLISPTGGLVPQEDVRAYLTQERFVPGRVVGMVRQARLSDLLAEGEQLPDPAFLQVLADIRAPLVAEGLCTELVTTVAEECAVNAARVVEGSVDPVAGTAEFRLELVYRLKDDGADLPDLAAHVLRQERVNVDVTAIQAAAVSPEAVLRSVASAVTAACSSDPPREACRPLRFGISLSPGMGKSAWADIAWLDPLPEGIFVAPPLDSSPGG